MSERATGGRIGLAVLVGLAALAYSIAVVGVAWRAPDKGFVAFTGLRIVAVEEGSDAAEEGLRAGDRVVSIDGEEVSSILDYVDRLLTRQPGEEVHLGVEHPGGERAGVLVRLSPSPAPWAALTAAVMSAVLIGLGLIARKARPDDVASARFFRLSLVYAIVYTGALSWIYILIHPLLGAIALGAIFLSPPIAMDFYMSFPAPAAGSRLGWRLAGWVPSVLLFAGAAIPLALGVEAWREGSGDADRWLRWTVQCVVAQLAYSIVVLFIGLAGQFRNMRAASGDERQQLKWLLFGCVLGGVPTLLAIPAAVEDIDRFLLVGYRPYVTSMAVLGFATAALAVLRVRLADVDAVISRSMSYAISSGLAVGVFLAVALGLGLVVERFVGETGFASQVVAALAAAALFGPIHRRVGRWLDRRFQRDRHHYVEALRDLSETVLRIREPHDLAREVVERSVGALRAAHGALYLRRSEIDAEVELAPVASEGGRYEGAVSLERALEPPRGGVAVPIESDATVAGVLVLGPRRGGDLYSSQDRDLLGALAGQLGVALANAKAFGTIAEMTRTLEKQNAEIRELRDRLEDENRYLKGRLEAASEQMRLVGGSRAVRELRRQIERVAATEAAVLVGGETGTGKGLTARLIHETSERAGKPFIHVDCGAIPAGVFESELFGHERGAFTGAVRNRRGMFELGDGGTVFLDEIGELPPEMQPKLLRVLQERTFLRVGGSKPVQVDVRVIAATNRGLADMVRDGSFREDLYYRLNVVEIEVPPLRARRTDIPDLVQSFLPRLCRRNHAREKRLTPEALGRMQAYGWPGNVRELENVLERALVLSEGREIDADDLALPDAPLPADELVERVEVAEDADHREVMEAIEKERLVSALRAAGGNRSSAARALGIPRTTFINKLRRYGVG